MRKQTSLPLYENGWKDRSGGIIVRPNRRRAFQWFLRAAKQGDAVAQGCVASFFRERGDVVEHDVEEAMAWNKKAIAQGSASGRSGWARSIAIAAI